ncbi:MAG: hypothetical protein HZB45_07275 [Mycolicibacterium rufum]|nr:hypothetical protein [Mycolicibacterium rufum]
MKANFDVLRSDLLLDALVMPINMGHINSQALERLPSASLSERQRAIVDVLQSLVDDGLVVTGYPGQDDDTFVIEPFAETLREVKRTFFDRYDEPSEWIWSCWIKLTEKGVQIATSTPEGLRVAEHERERLDAIRSERDQG